MFLNAKNSNPYINIALASFVSTIPAWLFGLANTTTAFTLPAFIHSATPWHPLMACALFVVSGVPLINFVSDMLTGSTLHIIVSAYRA